MEQEVPPPPTPQPTPMPPAAPMPPPPRPHPAATASRNRKHRAPRMGLSAPIGTTMDPRAALKAPDTSSAKQGPTTETTTVPNRSPNRRRKPQRPADETDREARAGTGDGESRTAERRAEIEPPPEAKPEPPKEEQQQAALAPQPQPPAPPAATADARKGLAAARGATGAADLARNSAAGAPAAATRRRPSRRCSRNRRRRRTRRRSSIPPAARQQLPSSPLSHLPQQRSPAEPQQASRQAPSSAFVNPADAYGQRKRAGRLCLERRPEDRRASLLCARKQRRRARRGAAHDRPRRPVARRRHQPIERLQDARQCGARTSSAPPAPYAPLPNDVLGDRHTFVVPLNYRRNSIVGCCSRSTSRRPGPPVERDRRDLRYQPRPAAIAAHAARRPGAGDPAACPDRRGDLVDRAAAGHRA